MNATAQSRILSMAQAGAMLLCAARSQDEPTKLAGRVDVHIAAAPGMTRKRRQPHGSITCLWCNRGAPVSGNKGVHATCGPLWALSNYAAKLEAAA